MKFRSCVLWACMLVVPMLAMFSHRIPTEIREALRTHLWRPAATRVAGIVGQVVGSESSQPAAADAAVATPPAPVETGAVQPQPAQPGSGSTQPLHPPFAPSQPETAVLAQPPQAVPQPASGVPPASPPSVAATPPATNATSDRRRSIEASLARLGAVAIRCEPLPGHDGMHVGSCHVPIDASGQLQRVFQAAGADPDTALEQLLDEVLAWRGRAVVRQAEDVPATRNGAAIRL